MTIPDARTRKILACPEKRAGWVIYQLRLKGRTLADVARDAGILRTTVYQVWEKRYPRMQSIIAAALDMPPQDLFPERYDEDGLPRKWRGGYKPPWSSDGKNTTTRASGNVNRPTKNDRESETQAE